MLSEAQIRGSFSQKLYCEHRRAGDVVMVLEEALEESEEQKNENH